MTEAFAPASRKLEIGPVIERTFEAVGSNFVNFALLALVLSALPQGLMQFLMQSVENGSPGSSLGFGLGAFLGWLVALVSAVVLQAAVVQASVVHFNGGKPSLGAALRTGSQTILPLIGIAFLVSLGVGFGFFLLIFPGVMLAIRWSVTVPVRIMEGPGVFAAMKRSAALTKGSRWKIFWLSLVVAVLWIVVFGVLLGVPMAVFGPQNPLVLYGFTPIAGALGALLGASYVAALYYELRTRKEGATPSALAAVFD